MDEENIEQEMRAMFGITEDSDANTKNPGTTDDTGTDTTSTAQGTDNSSAGTDTANPDQQTADTTTNNPKDEGQDFNPEDKFMNKQNAAFARMRTENKEFAELIMNVAKATGANPKNLAEAKELLKGAATKTAAKNRNIPEDVLQEWEADKQALAEYKQQQAKQKALAGFQQVKDMHGLSREEVNDFADKLIERKLNPFENEIDLVKEYRNIYFDTLIAKAKEAGVQEERQRAAKAANNSTTPSTNNGRTDDTGTSGNPIKSIKDLDAFLSNLK